jgi:putative glycosyltransferase (TIGR04372 family)
MGDSTMKPLTPRPGFFDYAISAYKSDWADLALASNASFFLGTPSGALLLAYAFGVPVSVCNHCLPICYSPTGRSCDVGIPKLVRRMSTGKLVHYSNVFATGVSEWRSPEDLFGSDYEFIGNTPDDILGLAKESVMRLEGSWVDSDFDVTLQNRFTSYLVQGSYSFGTNANCGRYFMRKYSELIT